MGLVKETMQTGDRQPEKKYWSSGICQPYTHSSTIHRPHHRRSHNLVTQTHTFAFLSMSGWPRPGCLVMVADTLSLCIHRKWHRHTIYGRHGRWTHHQRWAACKSFFHAEWETIQHSFVALVSVYVYSFWVCVWSGSQRESVISKIASGCGDSNA